MNTVKISDEAIERLARHFAHEFVWDWMYGENWYGYPDPENDEEVAEAIEGSMERSREKARGIVAILTGDTE